MNVGIQLYSVREHMAKDPLNTLRQVAQQGYRFFEVANHTADQDPGVGFPVAPEEIQKVLKETEAAIMGAHIGPMSPEIIPQVLEYHKKIGTKYIIIPMDFYKDKEEVLKKAKLFNEIGAMVKNAGMELLYHNHYHEFQVFSGETQTVYEILMENTDPDLLKIELDSYWAMRGGVDPVELIKTYGTRVRLLHQKDYPKGYSEEINLLASFPQDTFIDGERFGNSVTPHSFVEIGNGIMDIQGIIDAAKEHAAVECIVLEQDFTTHDELESIAISMENFKQYHGLVW